MDKKQTDRRPDEKPAPQNPGRPDVTKPDAARRMPGDSAERKGFPKPEGDPIDKQMPKPGGEAGARTSSRASGATASRGARSSSRTTTSPRVTPSLFAAGARRRAHEDRKHYQAGQPKR